jgi:hypothetical protein
MTVNPPQMRQNPQPNVQETNDTVTSNGLSAFQNVVVAEPASPFGAKRFSGPLKVWAVLAGAGELVVNRET